MVKTNFFIVLGVVVLCSMVTAVDATEVLVESNQLVVKDFDDSIGLGAFSVVIGYDPTKTTVTEVTFIEPFTGATNIQPNEKTIRVSGFTVQPQLTGDIPIARLGYEGEERFDVYVDTFVNFRGDSISIVNPAYDQGSPGSTTTTKPTLGSTTQPSGGYQTATPVTASQTIRLGLTETITQGSEETPITSTPRQLGDSDMPSNVECESTVADNPGTPTGATSAKSPLPPILAVLAFVVVLFSLRKRL